MTSIRKKQICALLKGIETGDPESVTVVNQARYIQHNPQTHEGSEGLAELFKRLAKSSPRVNIMRIFEDGDFVFAHTEYDFAQSNIGFEVFRFEDDQTVEHWDNIQLRQGPNSSDHSMVDGPTEVTDLEQTETNRAIVQSFVDTVLCNRQLDQLSQFLNGNQFIQHDPGIADGSAAWLSVLSEEAEMGRRIQYDRCHRILAEGNFVLSVCQGYVDGSHSAFYDLFRVEHEMLVEHWSTIEGIPDRSEWKNDNGKF